MADSVPDPSKSPSAECDGSVESNVADRNLSIIRASKWDFFYSLRFFVSNLDTSIRNLTVSTPLYSSVPPANKSKGCIHYLESHFFFAIISLSIAYCLATSDSFLSLSFSLFYLLYLFFLFDFHSPAGTSKHHKSSTKDVSLNMIPGWVQILSATIQNRYARLRYHYPLSEELVNRYRVAASRH